MCHPPPVSLLFAPIQALPPLISRVRQSQNPFKQRCREVRPLRHIWRIKSKCDLFDAIRSRCMTASNFHVHEYYCQIWILNQNNNNNCVDKSHLTFFIDFHSLPYHAVHRFWRIPQSVLPDLHSKFDNPQIILRLCETSISLLVCLYVYYLFDTNQTKFHRFILSFRFFIYRYSIFQAIWYRFLLVFGNKL